MVAEFRTREELIEDVIVLRKRMSHLERDIRTLKLKLQGQMLERGSVAALMNVSLHAVLMLDRDGVIISINETAALRLGHKPEEMVGTCAYDFLPEQVAANRRKKVEELFRTRKPLAFQDERDGLIIKHSLYPVKNDNGEVAWVAAYGEDITEQVIERQKKDLLLDIILSSQKHSRMEDFLRDVVQSIKSFFQSDAVGIRLLDAEGNIPYEAYDGFPRSFYESENPLSLNSDRCMCIYVINGTIDSSATFVTPKGSFYINGTTAFLASLSGEDKGKIRNVCNEYGYESVALTPIRENSQIIGLVHVAGRREGRMPLEKVEALETAALHIGMAIQKYQARAAEDKLKKIEWLLTRRSVRSVDAFGYVGQPYGDLRELNQDGLIKRHVSERVLRDIVGDFLEMLDTSAAIYEKNGDYALGLFSSGWCRLLDESSRKLCQTDDNREALKSKKWLCHESCWRQASLLAMEKGEAVDVPCEGGLRLYVVPIKARGDIIGSINFGYGDPPADEVQLEAISRRYGIEIDKLRRAAAEYESRPPFIIDVACNKVHASARLIGALVEQKLAEKALAESEHRLSLIFNNASDFIALVGVEDDGRYVIETINREYLKVLESMGYSMSFDDVRGRDLRVFFRDLLGLPMENIETIYQQYNEVVQTGKVRCYDEIVYFPGGRMLRLDYTLTPVFNDKGCCSKVLFVGSDVTETKKAEEKLAFQAMLLDQISDVITATDMEGRVIYVNQATSDMFGCRPDDLIGKPVHVYGEHPEIDAKQKEILERTREDGSWRGEVVNIKPNGEKVLLDCRTQVIYDQQRRPRCLCSISTDITDKKKIELQKQHYQRQLQSLVSELTTAEERERKEIATQLHDQIAQTLVFAKMKVEMLKQEETEPALQKELTTIKDQLGRVLQVVQGLTNDLGLPTLYELGLITALREFLTEEVEGHHQIKTKLHSDGSEGLFSTDIAVFMYRAIRELLVNVIKYARAGCVKVLIFREAEVIKVVVTDDGVGMDVSSTGVRGSGFGLFSIRERLHYLGGELTIESSDEKGTEVVIVLPIDIVQQTEE